MLTCLDVHTRYPSGWTSPPLTTQFPSGTLTLLVGDIGVGKSTLLRTIAGIATDVDHATVHGRITVNDTDLTATTAAHRSAFLGYVPSTPTSAFLAATVEAHLAYPLESRGIPRPIIAQRIAETLSAVGATTLRYRNVDTLSAGQAQRIAIAGALTLQPAVLLCDEPTTLLDPHSAHDLVSLLTRLAHEYGITVIAADHRVSNYLDADHALRLTSNGHVTGDIGAVLARTPAEPVTHTLTTRYTDTAHTSVGAARQALAPLLNHPPTTAPTPPTSPDQPSPTLTLNGLTVHYIERDQRGTLHQRTALHQVNATVNAGDVIAVLGSNGAGKTTLLAALIDPTLRTAGHLTWHHSTTTPGPQHRRPLWLPRRRTQPSTPPSRCAYLPAHASIILLHQRTDDECAAADAEWNLTPGTTWSLASTLIPTLNPTTHPHDLSQGQQHLLALAVMTAGYPDIIILDEPTRSLDAQATAEVEKLITQWSQQGIPVLIAGHDVDSMARIANRVWWLDAGELVADTTPRAALATSQFSAPLVTRVCHPHPVLTLEEAITLFEDR